MTSSDRIIVNTIAQYVKTIVNMALSLYSTRLVLEILGVEDYGLYALVGSVVAMLSFITNALVVATQRFVSFYQGKGNIEDLKSIFNTSVMLHLGAGLFVIIVLECCVPFISDRFLNIPTDRQDAVIIVYQQMIAMLFISFISSPYRALLVSHENIIYISIIDVIESILKVILVLLIPYILLDKLVVYGWIFLIIRMFTFFAYYFFDRLKYVECQDFHLASFNIMYVRKMFDFIGWTIYSVGCIAFRTQGLAILFNRFFGSVVNAAYGIGSQILGFVSFISSSFATAINPQMIKSEGASDRGRMLYLAQVQSRIGFLLLAMVSIPCMFEIDSLLSFWLKDVPQYASLFCIMMLMSATIDQLTMGLTEANKAIGNIRLFTLLVATPKMLVLPIVWLLLKYGVGLSWVVFAYIIVEVLTMLVRMPVLKKISGLDINDFFKRVFLKSIFPPIVSSLTCFLIITTYSYSWRILITFICSITMFAVSAYLFSLEAAERERIKILLKKLS